MGDRIMMAFHHFMLMGNAVMCSDDIDISRGFRGFTNLILEILIKMTSKKIRKGVGDPPFGKANSDRENIY